MVQYECGAGLWLGHCSRAPREDTIAGVAISRADLASGWLHAQSHGIVQELAIALVGIETVEPSGLLTSNGTIFPSEELAML
jgi:hypothetical protein